jgi:hypothetical protein
MIGTLASVHSTYYNSIIGCEDNIKIDLGKTAQGATSRIDMAEDRNW